MAPGDWRRNNPRFQGENFARNLAVAEQVRGLAREKGCTPAQLALAWVLAQGEEIVPIPGTSDPARLEENAAAAGVKLSAADLQRIEEAAPKGVVAGARYAPEGEKLLNR